MNTSRNWLTPAITALAIAIAPAAASEEGLSQADLEEMLGPVALYPDSLLANVLAASIYPDEVTAAAKYLRGGGTADGAAQQGWEPSVQAIAKVPDVTYLLADNVDWTTAMGQAYLVQAEDVMTAVQSLRAKAKANGSLQNSDQLTVVQDGSTIVIESPAPDVIYVPQYNPQVVYVDSGPSTGDVFAAGVIGFGVGVAVGAAFNDFDCYWHGGYIGWGWHGGGWHDTDIDINVDRSINIDDRDINIDRNAANFNRNDLDIDRAGAEGQRFTPNTQKVAMEGGQIKTDKLQQFQGAAQTKPTRNLNRTESARASGAPNLAGATNRAQTASRSPAATRAASSAGSRVDPSQLKKVSPPTAASRPSVTSARPSAPRTPSASTRSFTPPSREAANSAFQNVQRSPSAFNRGGASTTARSRGAMSLGGSRSFSGGGLGGSRGFRRR